MKNFTLSQTKVQTANPFTRLEERLERIEQILLLLYEQKEDKKEPNTSEQSVDEIFEVI